MKIFTYIKHDSSRIPRKNFQLIGHLPLWKHLIYKLLDFEIFIDTDSKEVLRECERDSMLTGVVAYARKQAFIDLENDPENKISPSSLMVDNFLNEYVDDYDEQIVLVHVTSPFLKVDTLRVAAKVMKDGGYESINSVYSVRDFAYLGKNHIPINFNPEVVQRTQDMEEIFFSSGAFFLFTKRSFEKYNNRTSQQPGKNLLFKISRVESIEIDTEEDLEMARVIHKGLIR